MAHYHTERNHPGLANRLISPDANHLGNAGVVQRRRRLGSMLNYYQGKMLDRALRTANHMQQKVPFQTMGLLQVNAVVPDGMAPDHSRSCSQAGISTTRSRMSR